MIPKIGFSAAQPSAYKAFRISEEKDNRPEINVAINAGAGRIGKNYFRQWALTELGVLPGVVRVSTGELIKREKEAPVRLNVVAMNISESLKKDKDILETFRHDSALGDYPGYLGIENKDGKKYLLVGDEENPRKIRLIQQKDAKTLPWKEEKVQIVVDCSGSLLNTPSLQQHIDAGAQKAICSAPPKNKLEDKSDIKGIPLIVAGINSESLKPTHNIMSAASCTTTAAAIMTKVIDDAFSFTNSKGEKEGGIKEGWLQTTHAATNTQSVLDSYPGSKSRASINSIIPETTGAAKAIGKVLPHLNGKMNGLSARVPTTDASLVYPVFVLKDEAVQKFKAKTGKDLNEDSIKGVLDEAAKGKYKGMLASANTNATSADMIGRHENAIYIPGQVQVMGNTVVTPAFYDNEYGYTRSLMDLTRLAGKHIVEGQTGSRIKTSA